MVRLHSDVGIQVLKNKALSWGIMRKAACILAEITIRKSQYIRNAPASTPWRTFVWLSGVRWAIEQCFEEGKTELGMAHYEVRKYPGWHHHMLTTMLAHFFLWHLKLSLGKKSPGPHGVAAADVIGGRLTPADLYDCRRAGVH